MSDTKITKNLVLTLSLIWPFFIPRWWADQAAGVPRVAAKVRPLSHTATSVEHKWGEDLFLFPFLWTKKAWVKHHCQSPTTFPNSVIGETPIRCWTPPPPPRPKEGSSEEERTNQLWNTSHTQNLEHQLGDNPIHPFSKRIGLSHISYFSNLGDFFVFELQFCPK